MPIASDAIGVTKPDAGVIATRPATAPLAMPSAVGLPRVSHSASIQLRVAAAVAVLVATKAETASGLEARALPALNPNHPNHSKAAPVMVKGKLWGGMGSDP